MASSKDFLDFVMDQISDLGDVASRPMMGEYVIYYQGKVVGGIYDNRFLLKETDSARQLLIADGVQPQTDIPYPGAKEMLVADIDDRELTCRLIRAIGDDLPTQKRAPRT